MDRFEDVLNNNANPSHSDLHSSMDRFEVIGFYFDFSVFRIYIPVWIDLKVSLFDEALLLDEHLHSSMDRFEGD